MNEIRKIKLMFKSGYLTPLESDTILGYIFSKNFKNLEKIFNQFKDGNIPFVFSNGFIEGTISRPIIFHKDDFHDKTSLLNDLQNEKNKKKLKSLNIVPFNKDILEILFEHPDKIPDILNKISEGIGEKEQITSENKNSIPRFNQGDTNPFVIKDIKYSNAIYNIYVKIYDESAFGEFYKYMQETFLSLGWGKGISRGYGKLSQCELNDLSEEEKLAFEYLENLKHQNKILVLNNYKPTDDEIDNIILNESYLQFINKNTKTREQNVFKGNMKFISPGSVLSVDNGNIIGSYYQVGNSFNFGYLF